MDLPYLRLKKNEERRVRTGHVWIYSNEVDNHATPLKNFIPGQEVCVQAYDKSFLGIAYVNPASLITARIISRNKQDSLNTELFMKRIRDALVWRSRFFTKPFYRLIHAESDGLPGLIVDRYGDHLVAQINTVGMEIKEDLIITALRTVIPECQSILLRNDSSARQHEGLKNIIKAGFGTPPERVIVEENGVFFSAAIWSGQKTGWFYDHRLNRLRLKDYVQDRTVLDVFSYLGAWGIQAAKWGASNVSCLDSSKEAALWINENMRLNDLTEKIQMICDDAFDGLKKLFLAGKQFAVIILDPPAFVKKLKDKKEGLLAYQRINEAALKLLEPGGILISCSCSMHVSYEELLQTIRRASVKIKLELQVIERGHQAPDHPVHLAIPETDYLKMIIVRSMIC
jgi:23S rRNA (cytosine1962-C5)-methyltransferase